MTLQSVGYISSSWAAPASRLWVGGELSLHQRVPFPAAGRLNTYNISVLNTSNVFAEEYEFRNILSRYNQRNGQFTVTGIYMYTDVRSYAHLSAYVRLHYKLNHTNLPIVNNTS